MTLASTAAGLALGTSPLHAGSVLFTFHGQITALDDRVTSLTTFQVGDNFTLVLDFTPGGATPAYGYTLSAGDVGLHPEVAGNAAGFGPPFSDTDFKNPIDFQRYCKSSISLAGSDLSFLMVDEDVGPSGRVTVGPTFPADWIGRMSDPLSNGTDAIAFAATGLLDFNILGMASTHLHGTITDGLVGISIPVPRAIWPGLMGIAGVILLRRHSLRR